MPIYEYQCATCAKVHEVMQKFSDAPLERCPECGGSVSKLMSLNSFALKGSGWYSTDYKKKPAPAAPSADAAKPAAAAEPASTTPKAETKPSTPSTPSST